MVVLEEVRPVGDGRRTEPADPQDLIERYLGVMRAHDRRGLVDAPHYPFGRRKPAIVDKIGLVEHDPVGRHDLVGRLVVGGVEPLVCEVPADVYGIDHRHDGIEVDAAGGLLVDEERRGDRRGIGKPRRLDDDVVEALAAREQLGRRS